MEPIMAESTFTFRVDDELKLAFAKLAKTQDRTGAQLLRDFMRDAVNRQKAVADHDLWFRREVGQAIREADDARIPRISETEANIELAQQRSELVKRAGRK